MIKSSSREINNQTIHIETGRIAKQASGSAVVTMGETVVLVTVVASDEVRQDRPRERRWWPVLSTGLYGPFSRTTTGTKLKS
jgi:ribonuclease PH